jgi:hypothetical protein
VVQGQLQFENGRGYYIQRAHDRVWLSICEDKILVRQLQGLLDKRVEASGPLERQPRTTHGAVPPGGLFLQKFEIHAVTKNLSR